jgi:hypothetical protein
MRATPRSIAAIVLLALAVALGLAACNSEPTCDKAADRVLELIDEQTQKALAKFPESQRKQLGVGMTAKAREQLVKECQARFTKEQIACTVAAKTLEEVSRCNQAAVPPGAVPTGVAPVPTGGEPAPAAAPSQPAEGATPAAGEPAQPAQPQ